MCVFYSLSNLVPVMFCFSKYLPLCSTEERKKVRNDMSRQVNDDRMFNLGTFVNHPFKTYTADIH